MRSSSRFGRWWPWLLVGVAVVRVSPYFFFSPDDYYIYLRFVENLLARGELAFNPGTPTYGFTSALWLLLLAAAAKVGGNALVAGKVLSVAAAALSPLLVFLLVRRLGGETGLAWLAGLVWAGNAWLVRWSPSGLEAGLSAALALAVVWFAIRARERGTAPWAAAACAALAPFVRPEMIGLTILFALWWCAGSAWNEPGARRHAAVAVALPLVTSLAAAGLLYREFGRVLPNTAEAKGSMVEGLAKLVPSVRRIVEIVAATSGLELLVFGVVALVWLSRRRWREALPSRDAGFVGLMVAWSVGVIALYGVRGVQVYTRYLLIFLPFVVIGGFAPLAGWWREGGRKRALVLALGAAVLAQNALLDFLLVRPATYAYQRSEREVNIALGEWLQRHADPGAVVAVPDIGAIGYVSGRRILDLNGLVTPELIPYKRDKRVNAFLEENPPDFIIAIDPDPDWLDRHGPDLEVAKVMSLPFEKMYLFQEEPLYYSLYRVLATDGGPPERPRTARAG